MKLALLVCFMASTTAVHGLDFAELFVKFFDEWIPVGQDIDVMMLLDSSDSVGETYFQKGLDGIVFTNEMINNGNPIGPTRSGYIQFSSKENTAIKIHLPDYSTIGTLTAALEGQTYEGVMTAMAKALRLAKKEFFNINPHPNPNRPKRVLLVTDGKETEGGDPVQKANRLKNKVCSLLPKDLTFRKYLSPLQLTLYRVAALKSLSIHYYFAVYSFWVIGFIVYYFESGILLMSLLKGVASVAYSITGHRNTQSNRFCYFLFFGVEICVVGIGNNINEDVLKNIATEYYIKKHGFKWEPCYVEAEDWIEYKRKMRKAFRLLKKLRKGKGN